MFGSVAPNAAHRALATLEQQGRFELLVTLKVEQSCGEALTELVGLLD